MLRIVIVDDEPLARRALHRLLRAMPQVQVVGEAEGLGDARQILARTQPDAVLLDIALGAGDGFALLKTLDTPPKVIFVTGHPGHAVDAFAVNAVDYLLKPVTAERLAQALARVEPVAAGVEDPSALLDLRTPSRTVRVPPDAIAALRADGDFTRVLLADQPPLMMLRPLGQFETLLPMPPFLRVGRSLILNCNRLRTIEARSRDAVRLHLRGIPEPLEIGRIAATRLRAALAAQRADPPSG
ncbi:MAG: two-component system response regulator [Azorhizobium sp. 12-66-6]|nr:MAG: two-component system response regulator [Azorhizobium sp. 12-66-6]